ncbi:GDP-mannose transporter GONST1 [Mucuna pruriens]|uniref:GDP-mannose transporter GONST1 n=1 Tax=Mucuna pruriens TaxID=157652 RepID=A0A371G9U6_MUCPR|nr:GDP-mannose transporter GONST1 [Mucuna pruriens]
MKPSSTNDEHHDVENAELEKDKRVVKVHNQALLSGLAYCFSSCGMILVNKFVLSSYDFNAGISLMLYQNFISVAIVSVLSLLGLISTEPLTWRMIKVWLPVNVIFVGMLITSMFSLKYINVAMVTVLKNVTNVITALGEMYLFKKHHDGRVWAALFLMIISAITGGITDLSFNAVGYAWQTLNCFLTASYSLTLRRVMDTAKQLTKSGNLNEFSMVLLNNTLSLPLGLFLIIVFNEVDYLLRTPLLRLPSFWLVMTFSGFLGLAISFTSMWFLHQTGATTYSLVGSLNKIPLSIAGILLFKVPTSVENSASIFFGRNTICRSSGRSVIVDPNIAYMDPHTHNPNPNPNRNSLPSSMPLWPTIDGPLGLSEDESVSYARRFYKFGFALLPLLWAVNCFYFWPVLRHSHSFPRIHVVRSAVGFAVFSTVLCSWALTFAIGREHLFGPVWDQLVMYNLADRLGLTSWS